MIGFIRINGVYFTTDDLIAIRRCGFGGGWDIYRRQNSHKPGYYIKTFKYLKDAKNYINILYKEVANNEQRNII